MNAGHIVFLVFLVALGVYIGAKKPSLVSTLTGGMLTA